PYEGRVWKIRVDFPDKYPFRSPSIGFMNKIFHPASMKHQEVSLYDLTNLFESFLPQLLAYCNLIDPLNGDAAAMYLHLPEEYKQKIKDRKRAPELSLESSMSDFSEDEAQDMEL
ncbi:hypothetical protein FD755_000700, partial [Muntiacus reevesi]